MLVWEFPICSFIFPPVTVKADTIRDFNKRKREVVRRGFVTTFEQRDSVRDGRMVGRGRGE